MSIENLSGIQEGTKDNLILKEGINIIPLPSIVGTKKNIPFENGWFKGSKEVETPTVNEAQAELERRIIDMKSQIEAQGGKLIGFVSEMVLIDGHEKMASFAVVNKE